MGGIGSTRWGWHSKNIQVEDCRKIDIFSLKKYLISGYSGTINWHTQKQETGSIGYAVAGFKAPSEIRFYYTITPHLGDKIDIDYKVDLTTSSLSWGGKRFWFLCPLQNCSQRVGCLYLPPGGQYFGCRHCYELTYRSSQESHAFDSLYSSIANSMQDNFPGMNLKDVKAALDGKASYIPPSQYWMRYEYKAERYDNYLSRDELCEKSTLSSADLNLLEESRLLLPDKDNRYRPKLVSWGRKLALLISEGWEISEIRAWAKGRWKTRNPREWPPNRQNWRYQDDR